MLIWTIMPFNMESGCVPSNSQWVSIAVLLNFVKFWTSVKMPCRDLTLPNRTALLGQIKCQPLSTRHQWSMGITGMLKSTRVHVTQQQQLWEKIALCTGQKATSQKRRHEEKDPQWEVPQSMALYCNWMMCASHWSMLISQRSLIKSWVTRIAKQQMFGCLNGNLSMTLNQTTHKVQ